MTRHFYIAIASWVMLRHAVGRRGEESALAQVVNKPKPAPRTNPGLSRNDADTHSFPAPPPKHPLVSFSGCTRLPCSLASSYLALALPATL